MITQLEPLLEWDRQSVPFIPREPITIYTLIDSYNGGNGVASLPQNRSSHLRQVEERRNKHEQRKQQKIATELFERRVGILEDIKEYGGALEDVNYDEMDYDREKNARLSSAKRRQRVDMHLDFSDDDDDENFDAATSSTSNSSYATTPSLFGRSRSETPTLSSSVILDPRRRRGAAARERAQQQQQQQPLQQPLQQQKSQIDQSSTAIGFAGPVMHVVCPDHNGCYWNLDPSEHYYVWRPTVAVLAPSLPQLDRVGGTMNARAQANTWFLGSDLHRDAVPVPASSEDSARRARAKAKLKELRREAKRLQDQKRQQRRAEAEEKMGSSAAAAAALAAASSSSQYTPRDVQFMASDPTHQVSECDRRGNPMPVLFPGRRREQLQEQELSQHSHHHQKHPHRLKRDPEDTGFMRQLRSTLSNKNTAPERDKIIAESILNELRFVPDSAEKRQVEDELAAESPILAEKFRQQRENANQRKKRGGNLF